MTCSALLRSLVAAAILAAGLPVIAAAQAPAPASRDRILIAHRGASAYAPEHTRAAYELAIAQGADYVEQDLAVTKDGVLVCIHDVSLERTTNVEELFPDRFKTDTEGRRRWYVADFTLAEIKRLDAGSWFDPKFAGETLLTWDEAVDIVWGRAGMYPELKDAAFYRERGVDIVAVFAAALERRGLPWTTPAQGRAPLAVQSFDEQAVRDAARLLPRVPRTFLFGDRAGVQKWLSNAGTVKTLATFATDLGPNKRILEERPEIVAWAHEAGLTVTAWTVSSLAEKTAYPGLTEEMQHLLYDLGADALFTDNPNKFPRQRQP
ncbi:MAG: hypothetical protein ABS36_13650 [Acidobacteria bacterium SCN 69-37]|nr:MAG: hypothetical protein ABS36_13650 [Acidobacteria bacterium SCN 69-37]